MHNIKVKDNVRGVNYQNEQF